MWWGVGGVSGGRAACGVLLVASTLQAQTEYYNLDAGRATRVEDALPTERYALDLQLGGLRIERLAGGVQRWRTEPKATYGLLPFTDVELRIPVVYTADPTTHATATGLAGVALGAMHAFNLETSRLPALALSSEVVLPTHGQFGAPRASYSVKGILTRTTPLARLHFNGSIGTYSVQSLTVADTSICTLKTLSGTCLNGKTVVVPPDFPCERDAVRKQPLEDLGAPIGPPPPPPGATDTSITAFVTPSHGQRWLLGLGADRVFPLQSLLISGDVYAEHFAGLYLLTDWTAEVGARRQLSPRLLFDLGFMRRFAGTVQSSAGTIGLSYELSTRRR